MSTLKKSIGTSVAASVLLICLVFQAQAQGPRVGVKGGLNISNLYQDDNFDDENARYGFHLGLFAQLGASDVFAIQPELLYSTRGNKFENDDLFDQEVSFNMNYLDLPVVAVFKLGEAIEIHAGAYVGYLLNANISSDGDLGEYEDDLDKDNFKDFDYGLVGGVGFNFGAAQAGVRYNLGLAQIAESDGADFILEDAKHSMAQVYIAVGLTR